MPFPDEAIPPEDVVQFTLKTIAVEMVQEEEFMAQEKISVADLTRLVNACKNIISLSNPEDLVSNGEWRRAVEGLDKALVPYSDIRRAYDAMRNEVVKAKEERDVARDNALNAIGERDAALVKIAKVAKACEPCTRSNCQDAVCILARQVREILGVCPTCGILGRIADAPCTHLGARTPGS
jgi:hypothetical protein